MKKKLLFLIVLITQCLFVGTELNAQTFSSFHNEPFYAEPYGNNPYNLFFGTSQYFRKVNYDTNGDGFLDVVYMFNSGGIPTQFGIVLFNANGPASNVVLTTTDLAGQNNYSRGWAFDDFNGDGFKDFAYGLGGTDVAIRYYTGLNASGVPQYASPVGLNLGMTGLTELYGMDSADLNGDGRMDILVAGPNGGGKPKMLINNGDGTFSKFDLGTSNYYQSQIKVADIDNDNDLDLIIPAAFSSGKIILYKNNGNNVSGIPQYVSSVLIDESSDVFDANGSDIEVADLNNDSKLDIILNVAGSTVSDTRFFINSTTNLSTGPFTFVKTKIIGATGSWPATFYGGYNSLYQDVDNDGIKDILGSHNQTNNSFFGWIKLAIDPSTLAVSVTDKKPIFHLGPQTATNNYGRYLFQGDINGDNAKDYLLLYENSTARRLVYYKTIFPVINRTNFNAVGLNDRIFVSGYKDDQITVTISSDLAGAFASTASNGGVVNGAGTNSVTITGTVQQINNTLGAITYTPSVNGAHNVTINVVNAANVSASRVQVINVNTLPSSTITTSVASLTGFSTCTGTASAEQSFTVSGTLLTGNVTVNAPSGFEVSLSSGTGFGSSVTITASGTLAATTVYARLVSTATAGAKSGNITVASTGATTKNVAASGTVNTAALLGIQNSLCASQGLYWSTWDTVNATTASGKIGNVNVMVTHSAGGLSTTSSMFNHNSFPAQYSVPNGATLRNDLAGTFTFTFDQPVNNPQVAFSSIGNPTTPVGLTTSVPYQVIWNGSGMTYNSNTTLTGQEGFTIVKFPGTHTSITIQYDQNETYANIAFGAENFNCSTPTVCAGQPITLTASNGSSYQWSPNTGLSATNTAQVIATPTSTTTYTVIDPTNSCATPVSVTINVNSLPSAPTAAATQLFCPGATVATLQATPTAGDTIQWYAASTGGSALASTTALVAGTTYYAQSVNSNGCGSLRTPVVVATNNALHLDGVNDRVDLTSNSIQDGATAFTIEAWIKPDNSNWDGQYHAIFGKQGNTSRNPSFYLKDGKIHIDSYEDGTNTRFDLLTDQALISRNVWSHIALVKEGTIFKVYVNGNLAATTPAPNAVNVVGTYQLGFIDNYYAGLLDEVRFWNVSRSQSDIQSTMNVPLSGTETGLVDYFNFNQGVIGGTNSSITSLLDNTSNINNGTLVNFALSGNTSNYVSGFFPQITGPTTLVAQNTITLAHPISGGTWTSASTGVATVNASTGVVTGVSGGTVVITYTYCNQSTTYTVTVNALPTISTISNQILCANRTPSPIRFVVGDLETPLANLGISVTSSNATLLPISNISFSGTTGARTMNYTTVSGEFGTSTVTITINDLNGGVTSQTFTVQVDPDKIATSSGAITLQAGTPIVVDSDLGVNDTNTINGAMVLISGGFVSGDVLTYTGSLPSGVSQSYNSSTGVLTFTGNMTPSEAQSILRAVTINTTSNNPQDRTVTFTLGSALPFVENNHFYQFITAPGISWTNAKAAAEQLTFFGMQGYLTTVTSAAENQFVRSKIQGQGWMGASDEQTEGVWKWMTGPEAGQQFWQGRSNGSAVGGFYNNWYPGEPNDYGSGEDYAHFVIDGTWNDYPLSLGGIQGYVVEFGGLGNDPCIVLSASKTVNVVVNVAPTNITLSSSSISENNAVGAVIGTLSSTDADAGDTHSYTLVSGNGNTDNASFTIVGNQLKAAEAFDYELKNSYSIRVRTTDAGGLNFEKVFTITINNINETPVLSVSQNSYVGVVSVAFTTITVSNAGGPVTNYSISPALPTGLSFNTTTGAITGTPRVAMATRSYTISGTNSDGTGTVTFNLFIDQDTDGDGILDSVDTDDDGDSVLDVNDAFPLDRTEWLDTDRDGIGNNADTDDDNDGILDTCDADVNGDGIPDNGTDMDSDGIIDSCDPDRDGDGVNNTSDNCPNIPNRDQSDRDRDGLGDICDTVELNIVEGLTPNGDGINDTWVIYNIENHPGSIVRVFNPNGAQVYYSANYQNNWSGNYQGSSEMLPIGSYFYQIDLSGDGTIDAQGWIYITK